jgi:hypothetical protein
MADLAASAIVVLESWLEGNLNNKRHACKRVTLTLTGQGSTTNRITAAILGFKRIVDASNAIDSTNADIYSAVPSADGSLLLLVDPSVAANAPGDVTDTITLNVKGIA